MIKKMTFYLFSQINNSIFAARNQLNNWDERD